jgi:hypothetical protein
MNYVFIFKNDEALKSANIHFCLNNPVKTISDTVIYFFHDTDGTRKISDLNIRGLNNENTYVVLHNRNQRNVQNSFKAQFGRNVILQSNISGQFYFTIIPKLINGSLTFEDIKAFFPDRDLEAKLNLLHKCLSPETLKTITESDLNELTEAEKNNFKTFKSKVKEMTDPLGEEYIQFLIILRTQLL